MAIRTELSLRLANSPGMLARLCDQLSSAHVNLLGLQLEGGGRVRLVVDNPLHAAASLREQQHQVEERDVLYVTLPNGPGGAAAATRLLAGAGVNVEYAYGAVVEGASMAAVVIGVDDAQRAAAVSGL